MMLQPLTEEIMLSMMGYFLSLMTRPGFYCLEVGVVKWTSAVDTSLRNLLDIGITGVVWFTIGFWIYMGSGDCVSLVGAPDVVTDTDISQAILFLTSYSKINVCCCIISSAVAEHINLVSYIILVSLFTGLVFPMLLCWMEGDRSYSFLSPNNNSGTLLTSGFLDSSSGSLINISSGVAGGVISLVMGGRHSEEPSPHNILLFSAGLFLIWVGVSSYGATNGNVFTAVHYTCCISLGAFSAALFGVIIICQLNEKTLNDNASVIYSARVTIAGIVAAQGCAGLVDLCFFPFIGCVGAAIYSLGVHFKVSLYFNDRFEVLSIFSMVGIWSAVACGLFANTNRAAQYFPQRSITSGFLISGNIEPLLVQLLGCVVIISWTSVLMGSAAFILKKIPDSVIRLTVTDIAEKEGIDVAYHKLDAYVVMRQSVADLEAHKAGHQLVEDCLEKLSDFDVDATTAMLESTKDSPQVEVLPALHRLLDSMIYFKPFLPVGLFSSKSVASAPDGDIAIAFTDIQSSTSLWENCPDMADALLEHNRLMRTLLSEHQGYEVKVIGDAFQIAFESTVNAVKFCVNAQIGLISADWPTALLDEVTCLTEYDPESNNTLIWRGLKVRMGINCGFASHEVDEATGRIDYHGDTVTYASYLENCGAGGMILISFPVYERILPFVDELDIDIFIVECIAGPNVVYGVLPRALRARKLKVMSCCLDRQVMLSASGRDISPAQSTLGRRSIARSSSFVGARSLVSSTLCTVAAVAFHTQSAPQLLNIMSLLSPSLSSTDGMLHHTVGSTLIFSWGLVKSCKGHYRSAAQFLGAVANSGFESNCGVQTGNVTEKTIGRHKKYQTITGDPLDYSLQMATLARNIDAFALTVSNKRILRFAGLSRDATLQVICRIIGSIPSCGDIKQISKQGLLEYHSTGRCSVIEGYGPFFEEVFTSFISGDVASMSPFDLDPTIKIISRLHRLGSPLPYFWTEDGKDL